MATGEPAAAGHGAAGTSGPATLTVHSPATAPDGEAAGAAGTPGTGTGHPATGAAGVASPTNGSLAVAAPLAFLHPGRARGKGQLDGGLHGH